MAEFTPISALIGGMLIGLAATLLWVVNGRTAGISNIAGGIYPFHRGDTLWRVVFLVGLPIGGWLGFAYAPGILPEVPSSLPGIGLTPLALIATGLLVGAGTRIGRGCTSGHGVCGIARLSKRSFTAVAVFMVTAMVTVFVMRHLVG